MSRAKMEDAVRAASLESVLSTKQLYARPHRRVDYQAENRALMEIAAHMADAPQRVLQKIAEAALQLCAAGTAGISLLSKTSGDFYWPAIAGAWKPHTGESLPRRFACSGVVFDRDAVQLFACPERHFSYLAALAPKAEEALLAPFYVARRAVGTLWVVAHDPARKFDAEDVRLIESLGRLAAAAYPLYAPFDAQGEESRSLREVNEQLIISAVRQQELAEHAQQAEASANESQERLKLELTATQQLQETSTQLIREDRGEALYEQILDAALAIMRSQYASIQTFDPERGPVGALHLLGHRGFDLEAERFWEWVLPGSKTSCGIALQNGERITVPDVRQCEFIAGSDAMELYLQNGIHAMQSTPLISREGRLLGMLSTHWKYAHQPDEFDLHLLDVLARQAADFMERSQVQTALQESGKHFRALAEAIPVIVWTADASGSIDWYNNRWYEYTGQTAEEAAGWGWQAAHHPDDFPRVMEAWPRAIVTGEPLEMEFRLRRHDGVFHHFLTRIRPFRNEEGEIVRWYGSHVDIQAQKTALEQSQRVAQTLQGRFLPHALAHTGKVRFDATYTPAEKDVLVGGDWFEATQLPDGRYLISVGDVTGHGLDASVTADRLRQAITDFSFTNDDPAEILAGVNRILRFQNPDVYATAVVALCDRDCTKCTYASAGHPPPLLAVSNDTPAVPLPYGGLPLGVQDDLNCESREIQLPSGAVLALYTDGLTEFARDAESAERILADAVSQLVGDVSTPHPALVTQERVLGGVRPDDDVALLIAQFSEITADTLAFDATTLEKTWRFHSSDAYTAHTSRQELMKFIRRFAADPDAIFTAELILGEILANTVEHAPGLVEIHLDWSGAKPIVSVLDSGPGLSHLLSDLPRDEFDESGRGVFLIKTLAEEVTISPSPDHGTILRAVLPLTRTNDLPPWSS